MLKNKRALYPLVGAGSAALLVCLFIAFGERSSAGQNNLPNKQSAKVLRQGEQAVNQPSPPSDKELDDAATPVVDLNNPDSNGDETRRQKNARHDNQRIVQSQAAPQSAEVTVDSEVPNGPADLPAAQSDLIVEGKVTGSQAFLSEDKTGVYSEFYLTVSDVIKAAPGVSINKGDAVTAERFGGRVRYPSGQVVRYRASGEGSPMKGKKYLFFLKKASDGNYRVLTAYELQGNHVLALDGSRTNFGGRGRSVFDKHNGRDLQEFRKDVDKVVKEGNR
ncbi:MAG TPA: hypothetical protein VHU19_01575 [Pyrinomonadaceae bacterium]|jgi:hypothetical protein|nr:hypothetical protein [Pyrinomonadaceae bacterium]